MAVPSPVGDVKIVSPMGTFVLNIGPFFLEQYVQASTGEENNNKYKNFYFKQVITLEGWSDIMYFVQDSHSFWNWIYFVVLIVVS